jgi:predicted N-formylglutamate amidohydrolase
MTLLVTCEHGGNRVPPAYRSLFSRCREVLESHRGYDPGALSMARTLAAAFDAKLVYATVTRLLVELNRSPGHRHLFSEVTRSLAPEERRSLLMRYYFPYRTRVEEFAVRTARVGELIHISSHSFTPALNGIERRADIGLLFDPGRTTETRLCAAWQRALQRLAPALVVRRNYPYRGVADALTTQLRQRLGERSYLGIEIEINQKHPLGDPGAWRRLRRMVAASLADALAEYLKPGMPGPGGRLRVNRA